MDICFLFLKHLDDNGCFSLKLSGDGQVLSPPLQRSFAEIRELQHDSRTIVVESTEQATIIELDFPWLSERKARVAIPYALEEKLAQPVEQLHFSFDRLRYQNNHYLVVVISKERMNFVMQLLANETIDYELITLDWFALANQELCVSGSNLLINNDDFKGSLTSDLANKYIKTHILNEPLVFEDNSLITSPTMTPIAKQSTVWMAEKLMSNKPMNLCQGDMQHETSSAWIHKGYTVAAGLAAFWIVSLLLTNFLTLHSLDKQTQHVDEQIEVIYKEFFPDAKQVISPKFRIQKLIENNSADNQSQFWFVINQFAKVFKEHQLTIQQMRYQSKTLTVTLVSPDFKGLELFEDQLRKSKIKVKQTQASTQNQQVVATLELM